MAVTTIKQRVSLKTRAQVESWLAENKSKLVEKEQILMNAFLDATWGGSIRGFEKEIDGMIAKLKAEVELLRLEFDAHREQNFRFNSIKTDLIEIAKTYNRDIQGLIDLQRELIENIKLDIETTPESRYDDDLPQLEKDLDLAELALEVLLERHAECELEIQKRVEEGLAEVLSEGA